MTKYNSQYGTDDGFRVTVEPAAFGDRGFSITIWNRNNGMSGMGVIREQSKAERIAKFLYDELLPEFKAEQIRLRESIARHDAEMAAKPKPKPPKIQKNAPVIDVLVCSECGELIPPDEISDERVYECGECGASGAGEDARRCDQCNKFTAKVADSSWRRYGRCGNEKSATRN